MLGLLFSWGQPCLPGSPPAGGLSWQETWRTVSGRGWEAHVAGGWGLERGHGEDKSGSTGSSGPGSVELGLMRADWGLVLCHRWGN